MSKWSQLWLSDCFSIYSTMVQNMIDLYLLILVLVFSFVISNLIIFFFSKVTLYYSVDRSFMELLWTLAPVLILMTISIPSIHLLYLMEDENIFSMSVKIISSQWFWTYEYSDFSNFSFSSYMLFLDGLDNNYFRLLEVDNRFVLPMFVSIRLLFTSTDVIHSFCLPSLYLKIDCVPGRLSQIPFMLSNPGVYYGQCSEICGGSHSFMPIVLESVSIDDYLSWIL